MKTLVRPQVLATLVMLAALSQFAQPALAQQTFTLPNQTWTGGPTFVTPGGANGFSPPAGQYEVSFGPTASTIGAGSDWQIGTPGRTMHIAIETSIDGGVTWVDGNAGNNFTTGVYGKGGFPNAPIINITDNVPGKTVKVRISVTVSAPITCGLTAVVQSN